MIPKSFEYYDVSDLQQALELLGKYGEEAKILAGGQSLVPIMKLRLATPTVLIDIKRVSGLSYMRESSQGTLQIGALTTYSQIESSKLVKQKVPILAETVAGIGDSQVRNRGTIGGSLAHNDPAADLPPTILALDAEMVAIGPGGIRRIKTSDFFVDVFTTALRPGEILTEVELPNFTPNTGGAFIKLAHVGGDFVIVGVAAIVRLDSNGNCDEVSIALGGVGSVSFRAKKSEEAIRGKKPSPSVIKEASELAKYGITPSSDIHASAEYKIDMATVLTRRALNEAVKRAGGI